MVNNNSERQYRGWATHGSDVSYTFGTVSGGDGLTANNSKINCPMDTEEIQLSRAMQAYFANFAKTGHPNTPNSSGIAWPPYRKGNGEPVTQTILLDSPEILVADNYRDDDCRFWRDFFKRKAGKPEEKPPTPAMPNNSSPNHLGASKTV